jgi:hypothetical protein
MRSTAERSEAARASARVLDVAEHGGTMGHAERSPNSLRSDQLTVRRMGGSLLITRLHETVSRCAIAGALA